MKRILLALLLLMFFGAHGNSQTLDIRTKGTMYGFKIGYFGSGDVDVEGIAFKTDAKYSFGGFLDYKVGEKLWLFLNYDMHTISASQGALSVTKTLSDFGGGFKAIVYKEGSSVTFRPGLGLSYGSLPGISIAGYRLTGSSSYFIIKPFVELVVPLEGYAFVGELGFVKAPSGGNEDVSVTFGPMWFLRGGILF